MRPTITIIRGLPGTGKTTIAMRIAERDGAVAIAADDYFYVDGVYRFDASLIMKAHIDAQHRMYTALHDLKPVVLHNTFTQWWEVESYIGRNKPCVVISLYDAGFSDNELASRNTHGVSEATIARMRARWEW